MLRQIICTPVIMGSWPYQSSVFVAYSNKWWSSLKKCMTWAHGKSIARQSTCSCYYHVTVTDLCDTTITLSILCINIVTAGICNSDIISVGTNSFMYGQSLLRVCWVLFMGSESALLYSDLLSLHYQWKYQGSSIATPMLQILLVLYYLWHHYASLLVSSRVRNTSIMNSWSHTFWVTANLYDFSPADALEHL